MDSQDDLLRWAGERLDIESWVADSRAMGILDGDEGKIVGVGVLNMFHDQGCWIHIATDRQKGWATRTILGCMFAYPFLELGLERVTARVPVWNIASQILCLRLGFEVEGREAKGFRGRDVAIYAMTSDKCRWIK